jgi:predicted metal-dependent peptidase
MRPEITRDGSGAVKLAMEQFLHKYPLLGALAAMCSFVLDNTVSTMALGMNESTFYIYYNSEFVLQCTPKQLVAMIHHELRHIIFGHVFMNKPDFADHDALTIAQELTVNENLPEKLPGKPVLLKHYPNLPKDEDTLARYRRLEKIDRTGLMQVMPASANSKKCKSLPGLFESHNVSQTNATMVPVGPEKPHLDKKGGGNTPRNSNRHLAPAAPSDSHERWSEIHEKQTLAKGVVATTLKKAWRSLEYPDSYDELIMERASRMCGSDPGTWRSTISVSNNSQQVDWRSILRRFIAREAVASYSYSTPPRRFPGLLGVVAGRARNVDRPKVMVVLDTSGSMSDEMLSDINRELQYLSTECDMDIVECDIEVHRTYRYSGAIRVVHGRGGTSFCAPFEPSFLHKMRPQAIVYFTDADGEAPENPPQVPVLWVVVGLALPPVKWGMVARMPQNPPQYPEN